MKKSFTTLLFLPFLLFSCNKPTTDMPNSPFNDPYKRIGMVGEYNVSLDPLPAEQYADLKAKINKDAYVDEGVTKVIRQEETRDLKYAYFGKEVSPVSLSSMLSRTDTESRYVQGASKDNYVTTKEAISNQQNQTANAGIIKNNSTIVDYVYDAYATGEEASLKEKYGIRNSVINNDEPQVVTQKTDVTTYNPEAFELAPYQNIQNHFKSGRTEKFDFNILRDVNNAVYGTCTIDNKPLYLIKEGYSLFEPYTTTVGRTYKAVDNYFYEALLEKYTPKNEEDASYRFTSFRFYHELLILSKAFDEGVPVLYLDRPMVVEYSEVKYNISYEDLGAYTGTIPNITQ